jgi:hypothetical protein
MDCDARVFYTAGGGTQTGESRFQALARDWETVAATLPPSAE